MPYIYFNFLLTFKYQSELYMKQSNLQGFHLLLTQTPRGLLFFYINILTFLMKSLYFNLNHDLFKQKYYQILYKFNSNPSLYSFDLIILIIK